MKNKLFVLLLCLAICTSSYAQSNQPTSNSQASQKAQTYSLSSAKIEKIEVEISAWMAKHKAPALSVAIVMDNQMRWSKGYGLADVENSVPAKADTAYRLASISKSITATAVMQLVEQGKIDLEAPIQKYCPAFPEKQYPINARQLLAHLTGIRHNKPEEVLSTRHYSSINEALATFKDDPLLQEPETKYSYSTPGYTVLGCAIEGASGMSYLDYLRENIFKPAGMTRTQVDDVYTTIPNRARGYRKTQAGEIQNAPLHDTSIKIPGGGMVSTAEDLARFMVALNTGQLVKKETLDRMWTKPKLKDGTESGYAFGFLIDMQGEQKLISNDGSQAGTRTYFFLAPKEGFAITLMTNLERAWCEELVPKIAEVIFKEK